MKKIIRLKGSPEQGCSVCYFWDKTGCPDCNNPFCSIFKEVDDNITVGSVQLVNDVEYKVESIEYTSEGVTVKLK